MFKTLPHRRISLAILLASSPMMACSGGQGASLGFSGENDERDASKLPSNEPLAPPLFQYVPGPEGRAVGIRAIVELADGSLTTTPVEIVLEGAEKQTTAIDGSARRKLPPDSGRRRHTNWEQGANGNEEPNVREAVQASLGCPTGGESVSAIRTARNAISYISRTISVGTYGVDQALTFTFYFGGDGIFGGVSEGKSVYLPPNLVQAGTGTGIGFIAGDGSGALTVPFLEGLSSVSVSFSVGPWSVGHSLLSPAGGGLARGIQYDTGLSLSLASLSLPFSAGLAMQTSSTTLSPIHLLARWKGDCQSDTSRGNATKYFRDELEGLEATQDEGTFEESLAAEFAHDALPLFASLSSTGVGGPGHNVPAASNADMVAHFLATPDTSDSPINTSIDGQLESLASAIHEADDTSAGMVQAATESRLHVEQSIPSLVGQAALLRDIEAGMDAGIELTLWIAETKSDKPRFVAPRIQHIDVEPDEEAVIVITAEEIAALVGARPEDVQGATIFVTLGATGESKPFVLDRDDLTLSVSPSRGSSLVSIEVDLSTTNGAFPPEAKDWIVRPSMRLIRAKPGPPSQVFLHAPYRTPSGAPASFNVQAFDKDGRLVKEPFRVRFIDQDGEALGEALPEYGTALFQFVPRPSTPAVQVVSQEFFEIDGEAHPGIEIAGTGFSKDARVLLNGIEIAPDSWEVQGPEKIYALLPADTAAGPLTIVVKNPGGQTSPPFPLEVSQ